LLIKPVKPFLEVQDALVCELQRTTGEAEAEEIKSFLDAPDLAN
jgi:hypothetical protein